MTLDEIMERATISFPRPLQAEQVRELFAYFWTVGAVEVSYEIGTGERIGNRFKNYITSERAGQKAVPTSVSVNGTVHDTNGPTFDRFEGEQELIGEESKPYISKIQFQLVHGWKLHEYRTEVLQLWDKTRELVGKYFRENY